MTSFSATLLCRLTLAVTLCLATGTTWADTAGSGSAADAELSEVRDLRDRGHFAQALDTLDRRIARGQSDRDALLLRAMLLAETGVPERAVSILAPMLAGAPDAVDINLAAAYVYRLAGDPASALSASLKVLEQIPEDAEAYQHQVFALDDLGAAGRALMLAEARPELFSEYQMLYLQSGLIARKVRWGEIETTDPERRFEATDRALAALDEMWAVLPEDATEARLRNRRDRVVALRQRERMAEAIELFEQLEERDPDIPAYTLRAAADAYLYQREPERAVELYRRVLARDRWDYNARSALYWALIESERFDEAIEHIDALAAEKPMFRAGEPYWRRLYLDSTAAMARALANQPGVAQVRLQALLDDAPASALLRRELGTVYRWRGWPGRALEQADMALAYEPEVVAGELLYAAVLMDLERYPEAGERIEALYRQYPEDRHVQRQYADWVDRRRWGLTAGGEYGDSDGFREFGSRDRSWTTRLDTPWIGDYWRAYATQYYADARFPEGSADYDRLGVGIDWRRQRHHAYAELHRNRTGSAETGFTVGYDFHHGDHWSFASRYEHFSTEVPLRARNQGLDGDRAELAVRWRAHESFNARLGVSRLSISDGNVRLAGLLSAEQRLFAAAHHVTEGQLSVYGSRASQTGGPYFNPKRDASLNLGIVHDWLTWRRYDRSFSQRFTLAGGGYWQDGFGSHLTGDLFYEHVWAFSRRMRLRYGAGVSSRVYDGDRERRIHGQLSLEVLF